MQLAFIPLWILYFWLTVFMQLCWQSTRLFFKALSCHWCWAFSCLPGSWWTFGMSYADSVQRHVGHLLSIRGRWGMEWDTPSTGDSTVQLTAQMCWWQRPSVTSVLNKWASKSVPLIRNHSVSSKPQVHVWIHLGTCEFGWVSCCVILN